MPRGKMLAHGQNSSPSLTRKGVYMQIHDSVKPAQVGGYFLCPLTPKRLNAFSALGAGNIGHILDKSQDRNIQELGHGHSFLNDAEGKELRRRHYYYTVHGKQLQHRKRSVPSSRRKVYHKVVEIAPEHIGPELLNWTEWADARIL